MDDREIRDIDERLTSEPFPDDQPSAGVPWGGIMLLVWAVALIIFSVQNAEHVTVSFLGWQGNIPVALLVMVTALITMILTVAGSAIYRKRRQIRRARTKENG